MSRATVVIGSSFGDCGKGNIVSFYAAHHGGNAVVCRHNSGANAGHTVVEPNGKRFIFGHFGAGTLTGAQTFLSKHFVVNPFLWKKELLQLRAIGIIPPKLLIDSRANLTTPFDMLLNQAVEISRGASRHGSCGVGINETVQRCAKVPTTVDDINNLDTLRDKLDFIRKSYVPERLAELNIESLDVVIEALLDSDSMVDSYMWNARELSQQSFMTDASVLVNQNVIFEGAQGLLLDQDHHYFPFVTRSKTGLANVLDIADEASINSLDVTYVTRSYMTRHGAGPFPTEDTALSYHDATNVPNEWQGSLRFGHLDIDLLTETILNDYNKQDKRYAHINWTANLAVTCMDQIFDRSLYRSDGKYHIMTDKALRSVLARSLPITQFLFSYGPTRETIEERSISKSVWL